MGQQNRLTDPLQPLDARSHVFLILAQDATEEVRKEREKSKRPGRKPCPKWPGRGQLMEMIQSISDELVAQKTIVRCNVRLLILAAESTDSDH